MLVNDRQARLRSRRRNVTQKEEFQAFRGRGLDALYWRAFRGSLQRLAPAYVPFRLYRVEYELGRTHNLLTCGLDQVNGILDLFEFPSLPRTEQLVALESLNVLPVRITSEQAAAGSREKAFRP